MQRGEAELMSNAQLMTDFDSVRESFLTPLANGIAMQEFIATSIYAPNRMVQLDLLNAANVFPFWITGIFQIGILLLAVMLAKTTRLNLFNVVWYFWEIIFRQSFVFHYHPQTTSSKIILQTALAATFLFFAIGLNLICTDLVSAPPIYFIDTLNQLMASNKNMLFMEGSMTLDRFQGSQKGNRASLFRKPGKVIASNFVDMARLLQSQRLAAVDYLEFFHTVQRYNCLTKVLADEIGSISTYLSKEPVTEVLTASCVRKTNDNMVKELARRLSKRLRMWFEGTLEKGAAKQEQKILINLILAGGDDSNDFKVDICLMNKQYLQQKSESVESISFMKCERLLRIGVACFIVIYLVVTLEICFASKKTKTRTNSRGWFKH